MTLIGPRFSDALALANELHAAQRRKGTEIPYIAHLLAVAALVLEAGGDEDTAIAGLLHDAVEDQGGRATLDRIRLRFGDRVAEIVASDAEVTPKPPTAVGPIHRRSGRHLVVLPELREAFRDRGSAQLWAELDAAVREIESRARGS